MDQWFGERQPVCCSDPVAIDPIVQKDSTDCGIAAIAMLLGRPYADVFQVAQKVAPNSQQQGLWTTEIKKICEQLGAPRRSSA